MDNRKLSKRGMRRRLIVTVIETAIVFAAMLCAICLFGWIAARAAEPLSAALDAAARAVIG